MTMKWKGPIEFAQCTEMIASLMLRQEIFFGTPCACMYVYVLFLRRIYFSVIDSRKRDKALENDATISDSERNTYTTISIFHLLPKYKE